MVKDERVFIGNGVERVVARCDAPETQGAKFLHQKAKIFIIAKKVVLLH
jgi:hypothetical protein